MPRVLQVADCLMAKVHQDFTYAPGATEIATPLLEVFHKRRGVCQDYAHMMIACLRSAGLAARYVSGYLRTYNGSLDDEPPAPASAEPATDTPEGLVGADASHAWVAVFAPPFGWVEFDPTNNMRVQQDHVALAWGRDFGDVSPLRGVILGGGSHTLSVRVAVQPALIIPIMQAFEAAQRHALATLTERAPGVAAAMQRADSALTQSAARVLATSEFVLDALCRDPALWRIRDRAARTRGSKRALLDAA